MGYFNFRLGIVNKNLVSGTNQIKITNEKLRFLANQRRKSSHVSSQLFGKIGKKRNNAKKVVLNDSRRDIGTSLLGSRCRQ